MTPDAAAAARDGAVIGVGPVRERPGLAGSLPAILVEGLGPGLVVGLTTRERNFRFGLRDEDPDVARAYAELDAFAEPFGGWVRVRQVHGARVLRVGAGEEPLDGATLGEADGLVRGGRGAPTSLAGAPTRADRLLAITVADCVPVFLAWPGGYGLLHAGWRGTAAGVLETALAAAGAPPDEVRAHLGPAIGGCCYEVDRKVVEAVYGRGGEAAGEAEGALRRGRGDRWMLDLRAALVARAADAGLRRERVSTSASCTACDGRFHSFRASGARSVRSAMLAFLGRRG